MTDTLTIALLGALVFLAFFVGRASAFREAADILQRIQDSQDSDDAAP